MYRIKKYKMTSKITVAKINLQNKPNPNMEKKMKENHLRIIIAIDSKG